MDITGTGGVTFGVILFGWRKRKRVTPRAGLSFYVSTTGANTGNNGVPEGTPGDGPWRNIGVGQSRIGAGDTLFVYGGTYTSWSDFINTVMTPGGVPSGTDFGTGALTIRAMPGQTVIIKPT